jgi:hypothetical protein
MFHTVSSRFTSFLVSIALVALVAYPILNAAAGIVA